MNNIYLGVPCSNAIETSIMPCTREDEAVAIAFGMKLCGVDNVEVFMQNSGFACCGDIITSLLKPYGIEIPFNIYQGSDCPQHKFMNDNQSKFEGLLL